MSKQTIELELGVDEANLILEALGTLPFVRVYTLIGRIQAQAQAQISGETAEQGVPTTMNGVESAVTRSPTYAVNGTVERHPIRGADQR